MVCAGPASIPPSVSVSQPAIDAMPHHAGAVSIRHSLFVSCVFVVSAARLQADDGSDDTGAGVHVHGADSLQELQPGLLHRVPHTLVAVRSDLGSGRATAATLQFIAMVTPVWAAALVCAIDWGLRRNIFMSHVPLV